MILNQWSRRNCGVFATLAILQHKWINLSIEEFQDKKAPYIPLIEKLFVESGLVKEFVPLRTITIVDRWIAKWEYILTGSNRWNFSNPPNVTFDWKSQHWFVIVENLWDTYKCLNSWWEDWWDKWYFYIKKSDFSKLFCPLRIVANKK